jgi:hypothetical protein
VREHLRACAHCRATLRAYRAAPKAAAALAPTLPLGRSLLDRAHEAVAGLAARFAPSGDSTLGGVASAGGSRGAGVAALAKIAALCVGTAGGAAACVATGVVPTPLEPGREQVRAAHIARPLDREAKREFVTETGIDYETEAPVEAVEPTPTPEPQPEQHESKSSQPPTHEAEPPPEPEPAVSDGAIEFEEPPPPEPVTSSERSYSPPPSTTSSSSSGGGNPAGEFGP